LTVVILGNLTNVFGGFAVKGSPNIQTIPSVDTFNYEVRRRLLDFVYLGIGVTFASYIAAVSWIVTGERISRRIRGYISYW